MIRRGKRYAARTVTRPVTGLLAVEMSRNELSEGSNTEAKKLAQSIIDSQTAEITTMKAMLAR